MALGLYGEALNVSNTSATVYSDCGEIPAASFTASAKYFLIANILFEGSSATNDINIRWCHGPDGSEVDFTDGTWRRDSQGGGSGNNFGAIQMFTQPGTTEQVKLMIKAVGTPNTVVANLGEIFALDLTDLTENTDYYYAEHTTDDSTMTTTFEDGASITITGNGSDVWWVVGDVLRNTGSTTVSDHTRLNLDGNVDHRYINEGDDATNDRNSWLFSRPFVPDSSSVCKMQYGVESGTTGTYFSSRIFAINLTKFAQFFSEDTTADSGSIQTNFVTLATESVTPDTTGDWFYIGGFTSVVAATTDNLQIRLQDDNDGSMGSDPDYGDDEPGVEAGDDTDENGHIIFKMKSLTSGGSRTFNLDARDIVSASSAKNRTLVGFALILATGGDTISPGGIASGETFGTTTVTRGAVTVSPGGISSAGAFGGATITSVATVSPGGIASAQAFGSPALTGSYSITANGIVSGQAFGTAIVSGGALMVEPTGIASAQAFGTAIITTAKTVTPSGIASAETFGSHVVSSGALLIGPTGIASAQAFGAAVLTPGAVSVIPSGIASGQAFGVAALTGAYTITASGIGSAQAFGSPVVTLMLQFLSPSGIASAEIFGAVAVSGGGAPLALAIDYQGFPASWIDSRSIASGWIDDRAIDLG